MSVGCMAVLGEALLCSQWKIDFSRFFSGIRQLMSLRKLHCLLNVAKMVEDVLFFQNLNKYFSK